MVTNDYEDIISKQRQKISALEDKIKGQSEDSVSALGMNLTAAANRLKDLSETINKNKDKMKSIGNKQSKVGGIGCTLMPNGVLLLKFKDEATAKKYYDKL